MQERLQKILAHAGVASRRKAEEMIEQGRVTVNGHIVSELGSKADAAEDVIKVDGKKIRSNPPCLPPAEQTEERNVHVQRSRRRPTVMEFVHKKIKERLYPVGRLDFASEGLIILTNDGEFTKFMTQAGVVPKVYHVKVAGEPDANWTACGTGCSSTTSGWRHARSSH